MMCKINFGFNTIAWVLVCCLLLFGFTDSIDTSLPDGQDDPAEADDNMRRIQGGFQEILAVEHNVDLTGTVITGDGTHTAITTDSITNAGTLTNTGNITVNTNKFTVTAASGNTLVAGTLDVTGVATLGDGSLTATSAAPTTDAMIANKKYVDDQIAPLGTRVKGWIRFNGTGTISINDSFNVSGITDNGTGDYTVSWDTDFATGNYSVVMSTNERNHRIIAISTGSVRVNTSNVSHTLADAEIICITAIGDQ